MINAPPRARFQPSGSFHADLKQRVDEYFQRTGLSRHGTAAMRIKTAVLFAWLAGSYALAMFGQVAAWQAALLAISIGLAMAGIGFSVGHDANHSGYSASPAVNRALGFSFDLLGGSSHIWRQKHNLLHHTWTNIAGHDADLEAGPLLRFAPWQERRWLHRFQHLYVWILYGLFPLRWYLFDDYAELARGRIGPQQIQRPPRRELFALFAGKAVFYTWAFVLPMLLHPGWGTVGLWLLCSFTLGNAMAVVFQLAHCAGEAGFHQPTAGTLLERDWAAHQVETTIDFARHSRALSWYLGGLNFQIEHHLFARICHVHYPALASIVEETCAAHGVRYRAQATFLDALAANLRWLRRLGTTDELAAPTPKPAALRRARSPTRRAAAAQARPTGPLRC